MIIKEAIACYFARENSDAIANPDNGSMIPRLTMKNTRLLIIETIPDSP
jgi:hypothetical protein